jgi:alkylhydroperoxidase family enzyme
LATGLTREQIDALPAYREHPDLYDERQRLAIEWGEAVTLMRARGDDALFARLKAHFSDQEIVELTMAAAVWNMTNRLNESLHTHLEDHAAAIRPVTHVEQEALLEYVRRVTGATLADAHGA